MKRQGINKLARTLDGHARKVAAPRWPSAELGEIQGDMSLLLDTYSVPIPQGDYLVDERFTQPVVVFTTELTGGGAGDPAFEAHAHEVKRTGTVFRPLAPGDRVACLILDASGDSPTPFVIGRE